MCTSCSIKYGHLKVGMFNMNDREMLHVSNNAVGVLALHDVRFVSFPLLAFGA